MWTEEQFNELEQEERTLTEEAIAAMIVLLMLTKHELEKELRSFYQKYGRDGVVTWQQARKWVDDKDHRHRITALLMVLSDHFDKLHLKLNPKFDTFLSKVVDKELDFFDVDLDIEDILNTPWGVDETTWFKRLADDVELWNIYVANDLKRSFMRQDNVEDVIEKLNKRFTTMENVIQKLAMTESTAVGSLARREIFKELGVNKYRYYAREDERTCETCGSLHGLIFPVSAYEIGVNASPMHPWCRCWEVPVME
jgi:SPP1 gp7 family putative phage head morphogenesis protein